MDKSDSVQRRMGLESDSNPNTRRIPLWKKLLFSSIMFLTLGPIYFLGEIAYRRAYSVPLFPQSLQVGRDTRPFNDHDTRVMDFHSVHYYEIFEESRNPALYYEPKPNFSKGAVSINSHGFRDREFSVRKPEGTTRIVVLGDSIIWGHGLRLEDTFAKQLERLLGQKLGAGYEVLNFGVSGYSLQQEAEFYLTRAIRFDPDIVIIGSCINDFQYSSVEGDFFRATSSGILDKSYLIEFLKLSASTTLYRYFGVAPRYLEDIVDVRYHLQRLREASPDARWMLLMFPQLTDLRNYRFRWQHAMLTDPAREVGFVVRDLLEDFRGKPAELLGVDHIHPSGFGNRVAAEAAYETLVENRMIPRSDRGPGRASSGMLEK